MKATSSMMCCRSTCVDTSLARNDHLSAGKLHSFVPTSFCTPFTEQSLIHGVSKKNATETSVDSLRQFTSVIKIFSEHVSLFSSRLGTGSRKNILNIHCKIEQFYHYFGVDKPWQCLQKNKVHFQASVNVRTLRVEKRGVVDAFITIR